ncbi:ABC transporter ATP-binding protein [Corynebacterium auriscanis]|uniref:ABC transporter ATP-binding protein n=1 Tax=Corynebacterium auriscanis TaxID=99807 RepID=UPI002247A104|nr:ABC transporter ATP-binding protein [Corynebacterium auriscanis]MCX2163724.1 ABC transporter ATP-binding protein [Corynebacterium auriscanis]
MVNTAEPSSQTILQLDNVVKKFGATVAVDHLSLHVNAGEVVSILGPNGAGKTTTIEMCEGFGSPDSGTVRVFGLDPSTNSDEVRARIGVMLQGGGAYPGIRVGEMIRLVASYYDNPLDPGWLMETVGLTKHAKTPYRRLSGGQQQRLSLACALVGRPELVFLDEPTAGLDAQSRLAVWELIRALRRDGASVVLTTHLMDEAENLSDRIYIIDRGQLVAGGTTEQIISGEVGSVRTDIRSENRAARGVETKRQTQNPPRRVTFQLADSQRDVQWLAQAVREELDEPKVEMTATRPGWWELTHLDVTPAALALLTAKFAEHDILIRSIEVDKRSLEDVFLDITGREMR